MSLYIKTYWRVPALAVTLIALVAIGATLFYQASSTEAALPMPPATRP
jgi:hypothetical protein